MKRILITGASSYIGINLEKRLQDSENKYQVDTIDMRDNQWMHHDFQMYEVVFHVAGIVHQKENKKNRLLYYQVNRDLAYQTALKAKDSGVKQFIFLSTMSVYGIERGVITKKTSPNPKSAYGKSKYEAEKKIQELQSENFKIVILRPPMVYGLNCPGNYARLERLALKLPLYPNINNKRSMIHIDKLTSYVENLMIQKKQGLFFPQDEKYANTTDLITRIRLEQNKKARSTRFFNIFIYLLMFLSPIKKMFGSLIYDIKEDIS